ncbi:PD-(D/E)XK nuclease family protein [Chitinimonas sp. PSY-7]|uniref:PD-(D/E)XK nuclease family protein n=1 Tax=Chitinimonas sp. PSY-7 TaxID=3459088 RepID=UPI00403FFB0B
MNPDYQAPRQVVTVRASSWGKLFDCAHKWEGEHLLGMHKPSGPRALLGTAIHASTATFDQARIEGKALTPNEAAGALVDMLHTPPFEVAWTDDDLNLRDAESIGLSLHTRYCLDWSPRFEFVAVEMTTKPFQIDCGGGMVVELTGTLDRSRIRRETQGVGISDLKSGGAAVEKGRAKTKGHLAQVGTYELLYEHTTGIAPNAPAEIIGLKTKGRPEIATAEIKDARRAMVGDAENRGLIEFGAEMFRTGLFPPNPQSVTCHPKYCARWQSCLYHD